MKNKNKWLIPVGIVTVLLLVTVMFWQTFILYLAPKLVLAGALKDTISKWEARISASPIPILTQAIDASGNNRVDLKLDTENPIVGSVRYDMELQIKQNPRKVLAIGKAGFENREMDISLYLDEDFAAVSSRGILGGNYYGIAFDSFSQDIRSNKLIAALLGEKTISGWEDKIQLIQDGMQRPVLEIPDLYGFDWQSLATGILALDVDVERVQIALDGRKEPYYVIEAQFTGADIAAGLAYVNQELPAALDPEEEVTCAFWLKDRKLGKIEVKAGEKELDVYFGIAPVSFLSEDDLYIEYFDGQQFRTIQSRVDKTENRYRETVTCVGEEKIQLSYVWTASSGELTLSVEGRGERTELAMILTPLDNGFSVQTDDFSALMHLLVGTKDSGDSPCTMCVTKGSDFNTPVYKKFTDWSAEDLLTLLSGFGRLLGLELP